jgi:hypothetical protein
VYVAVEVSGTAQKLLPFGVFSTSNQVANIAKREEALLSRVYAALHFVGFRVHSNPTEALQIHCDMACEAQSRSPQQDAQLALKKSSIPWKLLLDSDPSKVERVFDGSSGC